MCKWFNQTSHVQEALQSCAACSSADAGCAGRLLLSSEMERMTAFDPPNIVTDCFGNDFTISQIVGSGLPLRAVKKF